MNWSSRLGFNRDCDLGFKIERVRERKDNVEKGKIVLSNC